MSKKKAARKRTTQVKDPEDPEVVALVDEVQVYGADHPQSLESTDPGKCMKILVASAEGTSDRKVAQTFGVAVTTVSRIRNEYRDWLANEKRKSTVLAFELAREATWCALESFRNLRKDKKALTKEGPYKLSIAAKLNWESAEKLAESVGVTDSQPEGISLDEVAAGLAQMRQELEAKGS